jgi:hypothetical protein
MRVGIGKADITPPEAVPMAGYDARSGWSIGVHDRLSARCFLFARGSEQFAVVILENVGISSSWAGYFQDLVGEIAEIAAERVIVACTHTHSGPTGLANPLGGAAAPLSRSLQVVVETTVRNVRECVFRAIASRFTAKVGVATSTVAGICGHRTYPTEPVNQTLWLIKIEDRYGRLRGLLANFPCHSTILGQQNHFLSGDLFGAAATAVERMYRHNVIVGITVGASGDISTRFHRKEQTFTEVDRLSWVLANAISNLAETTCVDEQTRCLVHCRTFFLPYKPKPSLEIVRQTIVQLNGELKRLQSEKGRAPGDVRILQTRLEGASALLALAESGKLDHSGEQATLTGVRIGRGLFVTFPGEPFNTIQRHITRNIASEDRATIFSLVNGYLGYFPDETAVKEGWYEAQISSFDNESTRILTEEALSLLKELGGTQHE